MSGYEALLETYDEQHKYENTTFSNISECLESLTAFVNEEVDFNVTISLNEAENGLKDKAARISEAVKNGAKKLAAKLEEFITKISETLAHFVAKAKEVIANKGNQALSKMITKNSDAKLVKAIKVETILKGEEDVKKVFEAVLTAAEDLNKQGKAAVEFIGKGGATAITLVPESVETAVSALANKPKHEPVKLDPASNYTIVKLYESYVKPYTEIIKTELKKIEDNCKSAQKCAKEVASKLKSENTMGSSDLQRISAFSAAVMKLNTGILNYAFDVLTVCTKNSARIALASGASTGKAAVDAGKAKAEKATDKVKGAFKKDAKEETPAEA